MYGIFEKEGKLVITPIVKKTILLFCTLVMLFSLSSCGRYGKLYKEVDALTLEVTFPEAESGAKTVEEAREGIYNQQISLALAYKEAEEITEIDKYSDRYTNISNEKLVAELSKTRNRINNNTNEAFRQNIEIILKDAQDCSNVAVYANKRIEEVRGFYTDYISLQSLTEEDCDEVTNMLLSYAESKNEFAKWMLKQKEPLIAECATMVIEENGSVTDDHSVALQKNNEIITALNKLYGGVRKNTDHASRIKTANGKLYSYVTELLQMRQEKMSAVETH